MTIVIESIVLYNVPEENGFCLWPSCWAKANFFALAANAFVIASTHWPCGTNLFRHQIQKRRSRKERVYRNQRLVHFSAPSSVRPDYFLCEENPTHQNAKQDLVPWSIRRHKQHFTDKQHTAQSLIIHHGQVNKKHSGHAASNTGSRCQENFRLQTLHVHHGIEQLWRGERPTRRHCYPRRW